MSPHLTPTLSTGIDPVSESRPFPGSRSTRGLRAPSSLLSLLPLLDPLARDPPPRAPERRRKTTPGRGCSLHFCAWGASHPCTLADVSGAAEGAGSRRARRRPTSGPRGRTQTPRSRLRLGPASVARPRGDLAFALSPAPPSRLGRGSVAGDGTRRRPGCPRGSIPPPTRRVTPGSAP